MLRLVPAAEAGVLGPVDAAVAPGITAEDPPAREGGALEKTVDPERVQRVLLARGVVLAGPGRREQPERVAPYEDQADADIPHAEAFPRTSVTWSTSH